LIYHILHFRIFYDVSVIISLMIYVSICYVVHVGVNTLQPMIRLKTPLQLLQQKVKLTYREKLLTFSPTIHRDEWVLLSSKMIFEL